MSQMVSPVFKNGWNAAATGALASSNPHPEVAIDDPAAPMWAMMNAYSRHIPGATNWNLWLSGYTAYFESEYHCLANQRYQRFKQDGQKIEIFEAGAERIDEELYYVDGSAVKITKSHVFVFSKQRRQFIQYTLGGPAILLASAGSQADGIPPV